MPDSVNVEVLKALLEVDYDPSKMAKFLDQLTTAKARSNQQKNEGDKLVKSFKSLAASLDPVVARQQKYEQGAKTLESSLKKGLITQNQYESSLNKLKEKYTESGIEASRVAKQLQNDNDKTARSLQKLVAKLNPVTNETKQYSQAFGVLTSSLKRGLIDQKKFNDLLAEAKKQFNAVQGEIKETAKELQTLGGKLTDVGSILTKAVSLPIAAFGGYSLKAAKDFESSFAGVDKTVDGVTDSLGNLTEEGRRIQDGLRDLAKTIPVDVNELNAIAESAGQLGIAREDILQFTKSMADLSKTTNLTSDDAATMVSQFQNIFGAAGKDVDRFGSTLVALGNAGASTEKQILEMGLRIAGAGKQIGLSQGEVLALSSTLASLGIEAEAGGSAISQLMINMRLAIARGGDELHNFNEVAKSALPTGKDFAAAFGEDSAGAINAFIRGLVNIQDSGGDVLKVLDDMGISGIRIRDVNLRAAGAGNLLTEALDLQAKAWKENTALQNEAEKRYKTFDSQQKVTWNNLKDSFIEIGNAFLPLMKDILDSFSPVLKTIASLAQGVGDLSSPFKIAILAVGGLAAAAGPALYVTGQLITSWATLTTAAPGLVAAIKSINLALLSSVGIIAGVGIAINVLINQWKKASEEAIKYNLVSSDLEGRSLSFVRDSKQGAVGTKQYEQAKKDLEDLSSRLKSLKSEYLALKKDEFSPADSKKLKEMLGEYNRLAGTYNRLNKAVREAKVEKEKDEAVNVKLGSSVNILTGETSKLNDEYSKLIDQAREAVAASLLDRENLEQLLAARKISIDAMELQKTVQEALEKAQEAGIAATSEQRLEIIRNTIASFQLGNAIEDIGEKQKQTTDLFADNRKELEKQVEILGDLLDLLNEISDTAIKASIDVNIDQVQSGGQQATDFTRARIDYVKAWREIWKTASQVADEEIQRVMGSLLTVEEKERAIAEIRIALLDEYLNQWGTFFNYLGDKLGGVFSVISKAISEIQGINNVAQSMGGWTSALGAFGGTVAAFAAVYSWVDSDIQRRRSRRFTTSASTQVVDGSFSSPNYLGDNGDDLYRQLRSSLDAVLSSIGGFLQDLPKIELQVRKDGEQFRVSVAGVFVGIFDSSQEAIDAAIRYALESADFSGLSELVREVLQRTLDSSTASVEDLVGNLDFIRRIESQNLPSEIQAMFGAFEQFRSDWSRLMDLFRGDLEAGGEAFRSTITQVSTSLWGTYNQLRGIQPDPEEEAERLRTGYNAQRVIIDAQLALMIAQIEAQERAVIAQGGYVRAVIDGVTTIVDVTGVLTGATADLAAQRQELERLRQSLPPELLPGQVKPQGGRGGGGRGGNREAVRDFISDRTFDLSLRSMSDLDAAMAQLNREYDEQVKQAGKNSDEIRKLNALRQQEIALLQEENNTRVKDSVRSFLGIDNAFSQIRETASGLIKDIKDSALGDSEKASLIGQVLADIDRQIGELSSQEAVSLFGALYNDLQKFGASEQALSDIRRQSMFIEHQINMDNYRKRIELLKIEGNLPAAVIASLEAALGTLEGIDITSFLNGVTVDIDAGSFTDGNLSGNFESAVDDVKDQLNDLAESFKDAKDDIRSLLSDISLGDFGIINPVDAFNEAKRQFEDTLSSADRGELTGLQSISEVAKRYIAALKDYSPELASIELPKLQERLGSLLNLQTVRDGNVTYTEKFAQMSSTLNSGFVNLTSVGQMSLSTQQQMLDRLSDIATSQQSLESRLANLESSNQGNKRGAFG